MRAPAAASGPGVQPLILTPALAKRWAAQGVDLREFHVNEPIPIPLYVERVAMPALRRQFA